MKIHLLYAAILVSFLSLAGATFGQNPFYSETLVKYDLTTHTTDKPIPFDRSFTLIIEKLPTKDIAGVEAFEVKFKQGRRVFVQNEFKDCNGTNTKEIVKDMDLKYNPYSDTLMIFFPPLKPDTYFDIFVIYKLPPSTRSSLLDINSQIATADPMATSAFDDFFKSQINRQFSRVAFSIVDYPTYKAFYDARLATVYNNVNDPTKYLSGARLNETQVQALDIATSSAVSEFIDANRLLEVCKQASWSALELGNLDIKNVFSPATVSITTLPYAHLRLKNLESNITFFDSTLQRIDRVLSKGKSNITVGAVVVSANTIRNDLLNILKNMRDNQAFLKAQMKLINTEIDRDPRIRTGSYIAAGTVSSDLKTAGGNVLFFDAGLSYILAPGIDDKPVSIPKFHWGISIYFRPIDKNTRKGRFYKTFNPEQNVGCKKVPTRNPDGSISFTDTYGPDYGIASKWSFWQHFSLNIGATIGDMTNKDFDNLFNKTSLLIGPAYRFARGFKVSGGFALLKRTSKNPVESEKQTVLGAYTSLSVDIDFIQGIKDFTSILLK